MVLTYFLNDFEIVPVAPIITGITLVFYIPHMLYFYCKVLIFQNLLSLFLSRIPVSWNCDIFQHTCFIIIIIIIIIVIVKVTG
jgi:hypothetical protein